MLKSYVFTWFMWKQKASYLRATHGVDRGGHVYVDPRAREVEAEVGVDEEAGARGLGVVPVGHRVLHVGHGRVELGKVELGAVD